MRKDMKKVIIERPRIKQSWGYVKNRQFGWKFVPTEDDDNSPKMQKMRPVYERNEHNDLISPLERFLQSRAGRQWNKVWAEICENNKDFMGYHLRRHVRYLVDFPCVNSWGNLELHGYLFRPWHNRFYVDPQTGILKLGVKERRRYRPTPHKSKFRILGNQKYYLYKEIWYRVWTVPFVPDPGKSSGYLPRNDAFLGKERTFLEYYKILDAYGEYSLVVRKEQAGSKECRKLRQFV